MRVEAHSRLPKAFRVSGLDRSRLSLDLLNAAAKRDATEKMQRQVTMSAIGSYGRAPTLLS